MKSQLPDGRILSLRAPEPDDIDRLYLWENLPGMWRYGYSPAPFSRQQIWEYVQTYTPDPLANGELRLIIDVDGEAMGTVDLYRIDSRNRRGFVGVMTDTRHRRQGFALEALRLIADYCRDNFGLFQLAAVIGADNVPSQRLFEKASFGLTASLDNWLRRGNSYVGALLYQKRL